MQLPGNASHGKPSQLKIRNQRLVSLLAGLCFFLSALEYLIPKPLPFIRIGLANFPLLLALDMLPFPSFILLLALKTTGQALISGSLFSYVFLFSIAGTAVSTLLMYALRRGIGKEKISLIGISAAGAMAFNGVQLVLAYYFVFGESARYAAAPILTLGIITGTLLGILSEYFILHSKWYAHIVKTHTKTHRTFGSRHKERKENISNHDSAPPCLRVSNKLSKAPWKKLESFREAREVFCLKHFGSGELAIAALCMIPALLLNPDTKARVIQFLFFFFIAWLSGKKINPLLTILTTLGIVFFNLLVPYGEILFKIGPIAITQGALLTGILRAVTLQGLFMVSRCCVRNDLVLPGSFGEIIGESFRVFSHLAEEKQFLTRQNWASRLDEILIAVQEASAIYKSDSGTEHEAGRSIRSRIAPKIILAATVILAWLPLLSGKL